MGVVMRKSRNTLRAARGRSRDRRSGRRAGTGKHRTLSHSTSTLITRSRFANIAGKTFEGSRDLYTSLGYARNLFPQAYRSRYKRNAVAARIVEAKPLDTWRGGAELIEDQDPETITVFEEAFEALNDRLKIWPTLQRADVLAGLGHYSIILLGAPGELLETPLETATAEEIVYLSIYAEDDATVERWDIDTQSPRFGLPEFYNVKRTSLTSSTAINSSMVGKRVHHSRIIHVADGLLDDRVYGTPRLERVWNLLDDLEKVTGGGAEAFWKRADQGLQLEIDPTITLTPTDEANIEAEVEDYLHGLKRTIRTRGLKMNPLGSDVASFKDPASAILEQISAGIGIPQRVLMGSEQGRLAADQDAIKYYRMIEARRADFAEPQVVRPFVDRLIELGALPEPAQYEVRWSQIRTRDDDEKATLAGKWAGLNAAGQTVVTVDEIRTQALGLAPLEEVVKDDEQQPPVAGSRALSLAGRAAASTLDMTALEVALTRDDLKQAEALVAEALARSEAPDAALGEELRELREELHALAARPINVNVQLPVTGNRRVERNSQGLVTRIVREDEDAA